MARVGGIEIPANKQAWVSLTYVFGIGETLAYKILKEAGVNPQTRIKDVSEDQLTRINSIVDKNYVVEGALRRVIAQNIQRLKDIACYRGSRHRPHNPDQAGAPKKPTADSHRRGL